MTMRQGSREVGSHTPQPTIRPPRGGHEQKQPSGLCDLIGDRHHARVDGLPRRQCRDVDGAATCSGPTNLMATDEFTWWSSLPRLAGWARQAWKHRWATFLASTGPPFCCFPTGWFLPLRFSSRSAVTCFPQNSEVLLLARGTDNLGGRCWAFVSNNSTNLHQGQCQCTSTTARQHRSPPEQPSQPNLAAR